MMQRWGDTWAGGPAGKENPDKIKARRTTSQITRNVTQINSRGGRPETWTFHAHRSAAAASREAVSAWSRPWAPVQAGLGGPAPAADRPVTWGK